MRNIYLLFIPLLISLQGFSQARPRNDSCSRAIKLCSFAPISSQATSNATDDGTYSCGGTISRGVWYKFTGYKGGSASIIIDNQSSGIIKVEVFSDCASTPVAGTCMSSTAGADITLNMTGIVPGTTYYLVVSSGSAGNAFFNLNITNVSADAVVGETVAGLEVTAGGVTFFSDKAFICGNPKTSADSMITIRNTSTYRGGPPGYKFAILDASNNNPQNSDFDTTFVCPVIGDPLSCTYNDTTLNIIDYMKDNNLKDSVWLWMRVYSGCGGVKGFTSEKKVKLYVQLLDARFDILPYQKCGQDTAVPCAQGKVRFAIVPPMQPRVKDFIPLRDSANVINYTIYIRKPCGGIDSASFSPSGPDFKQFYDYTIPADCYGDFVAKLYVESPQFCGPVWAYDAKGNLSANQDTSVQDTTLEFLIAPPPKVAPQYSMSPGGPFSSTQDTVCSGVKAYIRLPRVQSPPYRFPNPLFPSLQWGTGVFQYSLTQASGAPVTITPDPFGTGEDSLFEISNIPANTSYTTYTFDVSLVDANSCYATATCDTFARLVVKPAALVSLKTVGADSVCFNSTISLTAKDSTGVGPFDFTWNSTPFAIPPYTPSANPNNITSTPLTATTTFTVFMTDQQGCVSDTAVKVVPVHPIPAPTAAVVPNAICVGRNDTVQLQCNIPNPGNYVFLWDTNDPSVIIDNPTDQNTVAYMVSKPGIKFWVDAIDFTIGSSCKGSDTDVVVQGPRPVLSSGPVTRFCQSATGTAITPVLTYSPVNPPATTYNWVYDTGAFNVTPSATVANPTFTPIAGLDAKTYTFSLTVRDPGMPRVCDSTMSFTVDVDSTPAITVVANPSAPVCQGFPVTLTASGATSYVWFNGDTLNPITVNNLPVGANTVSVTGTLGVCTASGSATVTVKPKPAPPTLASGSLAPCENTMQTYRINASAGSSYSWSLKSGRGVLTVGASPSDTANIVWGNAINPTTPQTDTILVVEQLTGCSSDTARFAVTINPIPVSDGIVGNGRPCKGTAYTYLEPANGSSYFWTSANNKGTPLPGSGSQITVTWNTIGADTLFVVETTPAGCTGQPVFLVMDVRDNPTEVISAAPNPVCQGGNVTFSVPGNFPDLRYTWTFDDPAKMTGVTGLGTKSITTSISSTASGSFTVRLQEVDTVSGCFGSQTSATVTVNAGPSLAITNKGAITGKTYCEGETVTVDFTATGTPSIVSAPAGAALTGGGTPLTYTIATTGTARTEKVVLRSSVAPCADVLDSVSINIVPAPVITLSATAMKCTGDTVVPNVTVNAGGASVQYDWTSSKPGANKFLPGSTSLNVTYVPDAGEVGNTTLTLLVRPVNNLSCSSSKSVTVDFKPAPAATAPSGINSRCANDNFFVPLTVTSGVPTWTLLSGPGNVDATTGFYSSSTITAPPTKRTVQLGVVINDQFGVCPPLTVIMPPFDIFATPVVFAGDSSLSVLNRSVLHCGPGGSIKFTGSYVQLADPFDANITAKWELFRLPGMTPVTGAGLFSNPNPSLTNTNTDFFPPNTAGKYRLVLTVSNNTPNLNNGPCRSQSDIIDVEVIIPKVQVVNGTNKDLGVFCQGEAVSLSDAKVKDPAFPGPYAEVKWTAVNPNGPVGTFGVPGSQDDTLQNPTYNIAQNEVGITKLIMTVFTPCGSASDTAYIEVDETPKVSLVPNITQLICEGKSLNIEAVPSPTIPNDTSYAYFWYQKYPGQSIALLNGVNGRKITVTPTADVTYTLLVKTSATASSPKNKGCPADSIFLPVNVLQKPKIGIVSDTICVGYTVELRDTFPQFNDANHNFITQGYWVSGAGDATRFTPDDEVTGINNGGVYTNTLTYKPTAAEEVQGRADFTFFLKNTVCPNDLKMQGSVIIVSRPDITAHDLYPAHRGGPNAQDKSDTLNLNKLSYELHGKAENLFLGARAVWKHEDPSKEGTFFPDKTAPNAVYYPSEPDYLKGEWTLYYVTEGSCRDTLDSLRLVVRKIEVPQMFTPNGDGINETFAIEGLPEDARIKIFDRWGRLVYPLSEGTAMYRNEWDAAGLEAGTYYYVLTYKRGEQKGYIQVVR